MANYTKGEWVKVGHFIFSSEKPPRMIAETSISNIGLEHQEANAHLIAAAPDMAEALKALIEHMTMPKAELGRPYLADVKRLADKALAKAERK